MNRGKGNRPVLYSNGQTDRSPKRNLCVAGVCMSLSFLCVWLLFVSPGGSEESGIFNFSYRDIQGHTVKLSEHKNKVLLLVNVASECGFTTSQYQGLQQLYDKYQAHGLEIIGFPCNQFGGQEPGTEAEIEAFVRAQFGITFPLTEKIEVNGSNQHPIYRYLHAYFPEDIQWNFEKFLIDKNGIPANKFDTPTAPQDLENDITRLLFAT